MAADRQPARGYAPEGEPVTMDVPDPHIRANQIATITNEGEVHFMTYTTTMTAALFLVFLGRLPESTTGKVFLMVDHLSAHETPEVGRWVAAHRDQIEVFYLPRYARAERGGVVEQRPEGDGERDRLAAQHEGGAVADPGIHAEVASPSRACPELLRTSLRPVCHVVGG